MMSAMTRPSKRPADDDPEEDQDHTADDISSTPPSAGRKRRRISDDSLANDEDAEDTPPSDYESGPEEESDELAATQAIRQKHAQQGDSEPAECGILLSVELHNFMCHKKYIYELGPLINFICGANGSGKSAILTAVVLCLGGKASATNRGSSLKNFIRHGENTAVIICRLKNEGEGAYMPDEYGDVIQVERHFSRQGGSGFKIKSVSGRIVSTKKSVLEEICDHFALQIENPLNVLSQDMARQFISTSSASEKYKFFVKGVQLEQLDSDYRLIEEQLANIKANIEKKEPDIKELQRIMERAKAKDEAMAKKEGMRMKLRDLRRQIAWVQVMEQESLLAEFVSQIEQTDARIQEGVAQVAQLDEVYQISDATLEAAKEARTQAQERLRELEDEKVEAQSQHNATRDIFFNANSEQRNIQQELKQSTAQIAAKTKEIEQEEQRLAELEGGAATERLKDLEAAKKEAEQAVERFTVHNSETQALKQAVADAHQEWQNLAGDVSSKQAVVERRKADLDEFRQGSNPLKGYHPKMPLLLRSISQEQGFRERPIGPIGQHVQLLRPEWSSIIEKSFGANLGGFIVTSKHDSDLLARIQKRISIDVPTLLTNHLPLNLDGHEPDESFDTILRVLNIDNDLVRKQLIILHGIEQTILIPDRNEASRLLYDGERPKNVKRCYAQRRDNKQAGYHLSFTRTGEPSQDPIHEYSGQPRMRSDNEAQIRMREAALQEARDQHHASETQCYAARTAAEKAKQILHRHQKRSTDFRIASQACDDKVESLMEAVKEDQVQGGGLNVLRDALRSAEEKKAIQEESYKDSIVDSDEKRRNVNAATEKMKALEERYVGLELSHKKAASALRAADIKRTRDLEEKNGAVERLNDLQHDKTKLEESRTRKEADITDYIGQAQQVSSRIHVPEDATRESLTGKYEALKADIERHQRQMGGTREEIAEAARSAREAYKKGKRDFHSLQSLEANMRQSLTERQIRWKKFRSHISVRAKAMFTYLLSERSFRGKLITDHKQKLLELRVEPDITRRDGQGRGARTLSGGEKSFSQICLLLAIWEAMGSPIRCLDEFDVFMDAVNRNLSVGLLVQAARQSAGRQFVLISPGTKNDIRKAPDVHVNEVAAPERGQATLDARAQIEMT